MVQLLRTAIETSDRRTAVSSVLASFRMEGLEPDAGTAAILEEYAAGSISLEQFGSAIEDHVARLETREAADGAVKS
ncbi:MAG: antitoxin VbhA family protein [Candidatus Acidiferrales bacterium]|jgi:hypothetical protein